MNIENLYEYCLSLPQSTVDSVFGEHILNFRIINKIFAIIIINREPLNVMIKVSEDEKFELEQKYIGAIPAYHLNKKHWIGIELASDIKDDKIKSLIYSSYLLVVKKLKKSDREKLNFIL